MQGHGFRPHSGTMRVTEIRRFDSALPPPEAPPPPSPDAQPPNSRNWFRLLVENSYTNVRSMTIRKGCSATRAKEDRWEEASSSFRTQST